MANNNIKKQVTKLVTDKLNRSLKKGITQDYVEELRDRIVTRTRLGFGVNESSGRGERLKKLTRPYVRQRRGSTTLKRRAARDRVARSRAREESKRTGEIVKPDLVSKTTPGKSNLTATGQLLDSLTVIKLKLRKAWGFKISIPQNIRGRDFLGRSSRGLTNRKLAEYVKAQGRNFFAFTKSQRNKINKEIRNFRIKGLK